MQENARIVGVLLLIACQLSLHSGCDRRPAADSTSQPASGATAQPASGVAAQPASGVAAQAALQNHSPETSGDSSSVPAWLGKPIVSERDASKPPVVLFDSFHAHNFLHRGLVPGEHSYHHFTGLRRAAKLLEERGCEVRELLVGPLMPRDLIGVRLVVLNLPSIDRPPWLVSEIATLEQYVRDGGGIIFITDHSNCYYHQYHLLPLWDRLGLTPTFETVCERKADCLLAATGNGWILVRDFEEHPVTAGVRYLATQTGGRVAGEGIVAWTSGQAWADAGSVPLYGEGDMGLYGDMRYSDNEEQGKQGIVLARAVGLGRVTVIADQNSLGDAFLSYADNWRLWLSTCKWCGQFDWDDACESKAAKPSKIAPESAPRQSHNAPDRAKSADPDQVSTDATAASTFSEIIEAERDRNAPPAMPADAWEVHCWEPLESGRFRWGGTGADQYYYLWCWMNRWFWVTANDRPHRPREHARGRAMLMAITSDADAPELVAHARQTLARGGKVVLLSDQNLEATGGEPADRDTSYALDQAKKIAGSDAIDSASAQWSDKPVPHWRTDAAGGTLIVVADARRLRNGGFSQPEIAPSAPVLKWENELRQWLFEQP